MYRYFFILVFSIPAMVFAQKTNVSGYLYDQNTGETLVSAYLIDTISHKRTVSDRYGFYSIALPRGKVAIKVSYVGFEPLVRTFDLQNDTSINLYLEESEHVIGEVLIAGSTPIHKQTLMGKTLVSVDDLLKIPTFAGIPDLMKAITCLPGISQGSDGRSNIYVRGGDRGQNLILLDGAKLYNTSHFGGFVSLFNVDAIKQVEVYKSGFPSRFGGRLSSVIDISTRDGNRKKTTGNFSLGLLTSSFAINGPVGKKLSFNFGVRTTYFDLFTLKARASYKGSDDDTGYLAYTFYDLNAKLSWHISDEHKAFISIYSGDDYNRSKGKESADNMATEGILKYTVKNASLVVGDRVALGKKTFWSNSLIFSRYKNQLENEFIEIWEGNYMKDIYGTFTAINEYSFNSSLQHYAIKDHLIKEGLEINNYKFQPGIYQIYNEDTDKEQLTDTIFGDPDPVWANEIAAYIEDEICIGKNIYSNIGLRGVSFNCNGKSYFKVEPRISLRCMLNDNLSLKSSYTLMNQFNHVLVSNFSLFEKETWIASNENIPPQQAQQVSIGAFTNIPSLKIDFSAEAYYKKMTNTLEYKAKGMEQEGDDYEDLLVKNGKGEAYGFEFQAKYNNSHLSVDVNYVLSWSYRQFEQLNQGERYPFIYDRRHQLSLTLSCKLSRYYSLNSNFTLASGRSYTVPVAYVDSSNPQNYDYYVTSELNNFRMPIYHRLDLSLVKQSLTKRGRVKKFMFNIYNAYAHQNAESVYFKNGKLYQFCLFTIVPTISYSLEF